MSTSSVDLSSLLSALGSSASGINVQAAVAQALAADSAPEQQWQQQQSTIQTETDQINSIENDVSTLTNALDALGDPAGALTSMTTNSSDSSIVTASALAASAAGNYSVVVNNLASTASWYSSEVASSSTALANGSFTIQVGSGAPTTVTIGNGVDTLDQLASYINGQNLGITASVVNDSAGSRLALVSNNSGSANNFTVSNATGLTFTQAVTGQDASLTVDGIPIDSASNTVTGAVTGLTFNLQGASPGTQVDISVASDSSQVSQAINNFVTAYNQVINDVDAEYTVSATGNEGPLAGDSSLALLQNVMLNAPSYSSSGGSIGTLADLGITMNNDGTLSVDSATLNNQIQNNFAAVQSFMQGTTLNGFASALGNQLNTLTDPTSGAFTVDLQSLANENTNLQDEINDFQSYLSTQQTLLTNEYNQADIALQELPIQEEQINAEFGYSPTSGSSSSSGI
jgi:flagellar hook-associated protein 2